MPIDPKKIAEWKRLVVWLALSDATPTRKSASDAIRDLLSDREEMQREIEALRAPGPRLAMEAALATAEGIRRETLRLAAQAKAGGDDKIAGWFSTLAAGMTPAVRHPAEDERDAALAVLRSVEWDAETDRCPCCKRLNPAAREPFENEQDYGHGPACRLDALLRGKP